MRKRKKGRKLKRKRDQRRALLRNLAFALIENERIKTTLAKAKELRSFLEPLITKAKKDNLSTRRYLLKFLPKKAVKKLLKEIGPRYKERRGGYLRIIKLGQRKSNSAKICFIEFV